MQKTITQPTLFTISESLVPNAPQGFIYWPDFICEIEERELLRNIAKIEFQAIELYGVTAQRRAVHFGLRYNYATKELQPGPVIPDFLLGLRTKIAKELKMQPEDFPQAIINEYTPGSAIGWHTDAPVYDVVAGVSLAGSCNFRLRPMQKGNPRRRVADTFSFEQPPRSAYVMRGESKWKWQHSIPPTDELRYSITFRSLRKN